MIRMIFSKTQLKVMEIFVSRITEKFSIKQIAEMMKKPYPLVHRSIKALISNGFISKDSHSLLSLNCKANHSYLCYVESVRREEFLGKNKTVSLFLKDVLNAIKLDYFTLLIFGSCAENRQRRGSDIDVLLIVENKRYTAKIERILHNVSSNFSLHFDCNVIPVESAYEMLAKRGEPNVMNESLNKHILIFGSENYYRVLRNAG